MNREAVEGHGVIQRGDTLAQARTLEEDERMESGETEAMLDPLGEPVADAPIDDLDLVIQTSWETYVGWMEAFEAAQTDSDKRS